jgi:O-acetyl-ADP-ribose deacetylase (regulator of RNase III)
MTEGVQALMLHRCPIGGAELTFVAGDLLTLHAQGIVCYSSTSLTLHSVVAVRIVEGGGPAVRADAAKHLPARVGDALVLSAGRLPMRYVLVGVTNELRALPTLETLRASLRVALQRAAALELDSLALPILKVRRRLDDDDVLVVTLAALIDHLSGSTSLRRVLLLVDEDAPQAWLAVQRVVPLLGTLAQVGALRAQAQALRGAQALAKQLSTPQQEAACHELLAQQHETIARIIRLLEPFTSDASVPGRQGLQTELRYCQAELDQIVAMQDVSAARAVGG